MSVLDEQTWDRVKRIFAEALDLSGGDRAAHLDEACGGNDRLREDVQSLLDAHDRNQGDAALQSPFVETGSVEDHYRGRRIGPYRLHRHLGSGGMGTVYLAVRDQGDFDQRVAIKFVSGMDPAAVRRFHAERRILARLDHPGIARLLDGGVTDDGQPYLVMEYVDGRPITRFCEERSLPLEARIRLFEDVCHAVQFAHNHLVIHRDLKPSNILVAEAGVVKLLDFGIAKLTDPSEDADPYIVTGRHVMTPGYASPEQVRGGPVTTQSDVYSLGVLLYQLLSGRTPHATRELTPRELERLVCETVPPRASSAAVTPWGRRLRGDLDTIIASAMHTETDRRLGSARELAEDLRRYREGQPISSRVDSPRYRLGKFLVRNRIGVTLAAIFVVMLLSGILATARQARIAERRLEGGRTLANKLLLDVHDGLRDLHGSTRIREELVSNTLSYLDLLAADSGDDPALLADLAEAYLKVGDLQGNPNEDNLGDLDGAIESYGKAVALREELHGRFPADPAKALDLAVARGQRAVALSFAGRSLEAIALGDSAISLLTPLLEDGGGDPVLRRVEARLRSERGWLVVWEGDATGPRQEMLDAEATLEQLAAGEPDHLDVHIDLWRSRYYLGDAFLSGGDDAGALRWFEKGERGLNGLAGRFPDNPRVLRGQMGCYKRLGDVHARLEEPDEALAAYRKSLAVSEHLASSNPDNRTAQRGLGFGYNALGGYLAQLGRSREAIEALDQAVVIRRRLQEADPGNSSNLNDLSITYLRLADAHAGLQDFDSALTHLDSAREYHAQLPEADRESPQHLGNLAAIQATSGMTLRAAADIEPAAAVRDRKRQEAIAYYQAALDIFARMEAQGSSIDLWRGDIALIEQELEELRASVEAGAP